MKRREFVAAVVGLDRARWPVQPIAAENAINDLCEIMQPGTTKPAIWVDSPEDIKARYEPPQTRRIDTFAVPQGLLFLNNYTFPGSTQLPEMFYTTENETSELIDSQIYLDPRNFELGQWKQMFEKTMDAYLAGAFAVFEYKSARYVVSRPVMHTDDRGQLHHERKPAVAWLGGPYFYFLSGVNVPDHWIERDGRRQISLNEIHQIENAEVRRVIIEKFGWRKYIKALGARKIDEDEVHGVLWEANTPPNDLDRRRRMRLLELKDPSTNRRYFLRVPPDRATARSARAWTFRIPVKDFDLAKET